MNNDIKSIRPFIGSYDYNLSRNFYRDFGFEEIVTSDILSYFRMGDFGFYLQDAEVKDWIDNTMLFLEVEDLDKQLKHVKGLGLEDKYSVRVTGITYNDWGNEFFVYDPSGVLWHIGEFKN
jgi:catechol 2,3-dioxygenase-like lactoylglutathione lyase family enzyme